jgi:cytochrome c553
MGKRPISRGRVRVARALMGLKAGDRKHEMTSIIIKDFSPADSEDLAGYYSAIEIPARKTPSQ